MGPSRRPRGHRGVSRQCGIELHHRRGDSRRRRLFGGALKFCKSLYGQVFIATVAGVAFGYLFPSAGASMRPLGDAFIKLIRMIVAPTVQNTIGATIIRMSLM